MVHLKIFMGEDKKDTGSGFPGKCAITLPFARQPIKVFRHPAKAEGKFPNKFFYPGGLQAVDQKHRKRRPMGPHQYPSGTYRVLPGISVPSSFSVKKR